MSAAGYAIVLKQAESRSCACRRDRHSRRPAGRPAPAIAAQRHRGRARAAVVARAAASVRGNPRTRSPLAAAGANREMSRTRDFTAAAPLRRRARQARQAHRGRSCLAFAKERKYAETVAALAELSGSSIEVIRPVMQSLRDDGVLIPCRVAGLKWETVAAVLDSRFASGSMGRHELAKAQGAIRQTDAGKRPPPAAILAGARRSTPAGEGELRGMTNATRRHSGAKRSDRTTVRNARSEISPVRNRAPEFDADHLPGMTNEHHAALIRSASRCFSRGITSCFSRRSELCHASGLCL